MTTESDDEPSVPIVCEECGTNARIPLSELADKLASHNDRVHDGEQIAVVEPAIVEHIADMAADDLGIFEE
ncbi:hypothetical protein [Natronocalculus amylovorans]|uniref:DUF8149 domain-containing protein n=1 Tax=Natronocalculus amylovorans TaxID=2917812 RepID=A0AAE3FZ58_9EURY|nr:hypothetical protein [Natronocalculus amylovorans]MCL9817836.1 hypothetical protein [Natronocalculus amylovorans]NUE03229.1 hypothetical protein [Halorubraceae archaeon YAN]